eukprot:gnl/TRDRNA2_/TRDRNA2_142581_c1_seq1.p1 gnl/TRDRNA2_/TRDRNA2_142581_c1~~gnl/TRDRNA2_/TRDRNA2_142581_c1_seq1.p1  ORF type:complete len:388 (-),score=47.53 gnl/TRDRNA2_/TRDRNA2_142581_c1_seq1:122-1285(-)
MRMLRLAKLATIWERVEANVGSIVLFQSIALLRVLFVLMAICHWNACIWWMLGQPSSLITEVLSEETQMSWASLPHWTTEPKVSGSAGEPWIWLEQSRADSYIFCFYWTLGVMRTMPSEVQPVNKPERIYTMLFMFFAFSAFAICVAQITQTFFKFSERKRLFNDDMAAVRLHLRTINASDKLQSRIKAYMKYLFEKRRIHAKELAVLQRLPAHTINSLKHSHYLTYLAKANVFTSWASRALQCVVDIAESRHLISGEPLSLAKQTADAAWFLVSGRLHVVEDFDGFDKKDKLVEIVDEECLATQGVVESQLTVVVVVCSEVLRVEKKAFFLLLKTNPRLSSMLPSRLVGSRIEGSEPLSPITPGSIRQTTGAESHAIGAIGAIVSS